MKMNQQGFNVILSAAKDLGPETQEGPAHRSFAALRMTGRRQLACSAPMAELAGSFQSPY